MADDFDPKEFEFFKSSAQFDPNEFASFKQTAPVNTAADVAKSAGVGLGEGLIGLAGLPGDLSNLLGKGSDAAANYIASKTGLPPVPEPQAGLNFLPTSQGIQKKVEDVTGPFYQPQTTAGKYAQTIGQFAPAAIGGPGSLATRIGTRVVAPALASEAAGQATEGTAAEPYARIAGALTGGVGAGSLAERAARTSAEIPMSQQLRDAAQTAYQHPSVKSLELHPDAISDFTDNIKSTLLKNKFDPIRAPQTIGILDDLQNPRFGAVHTVDDLDLARQSLKTVPYEEKPAASIVRNKIDGYLGNIPTRDVVSGDANAANKTLLQARADYAASKQSKQIEDAIQRGLNQASSANSGLNVENSIRQQLRPILNEWQGVSKRPGFTRIGTPEEAALQTAVSGTTYSNGVRILRNMLGGGGGIGNTAIGALGYGEAKAEGRSESEALLRGLAAAAAGRALGWHANTMAVNRAQKVSDLLKQQSPLYQSRLSAMPPPTPSRIGQTAILNAAATNAPTQQPQFKRAGRVMERLEKSKKRLEALQPSR